MIKQLLKECGSETGVVEIYEAERLPGPDRAVERGKNPISESAAVARLKAGKDIVVCGGELKEKEENMKYFKPELLARYRSDHDDVADAADEEWERAIAGYRKRLKDIRRRLPLHVRRLISHFTLHDAKVILFGSHKDLPLFVVLLQLEGTPSRPGDVLALFYATAAKPQLGKTPTSGGEWVLYDEFDLDEKRGFFTHSLLLADGSEIRIRFHKLGFQKLDFSDVNIPFLHEQAFQKLDFSRFDIPFPLPERDETRRLAEA